MRVITGQLSGVEHAVPKITRRVDIPDEEEVSPNIGTTYMIVDKLLKTCHSFCSGRKTMPTSK